MKKLTTMVVVSFLIVTNAFCDESINQSKALYDTLSTNQNEAIKQECNSINGIWSFSSKFNQYLCVQQNSHEQSYKSSNNDQSSVISKDEEKRKALEDQSRKREAATFNQTDMERKKIMDCANTFYQDKKYLHNHFNPCSNPQR